MKTYPDKTRYLFTQLRARGISLGAISAELDVPKSTLGDWDKLLADEIGRLRAIEWEAVEEQFGRTLEQDLRAMAERIRKWEAAIDRVNPSHFKLRDALAVLRETRREYFRRRAILMAPLEGSLTRAVTRGLNRYPDESGRCSFLPPSPPRNTNDLQQPPSEPSRSSEDQPIGGASSVEPQTSLPPAAPAPEASASVTPEVTRGPISPNTHAHNNGHSADAACDQTPAQPTPQPVGVPSSGSQDKINHIEADSPSSLDISHSSLPAGARGNSAMTRNPVIPL